MEKLFTHVIIETLPHFGRILLTKLHNVSTSSDFSMKLRLSLGRALAVLASALITLCPQGAGRTFNPHEKCHL